MEITYARKENTCHLPGLVHIELGNLSRQNLQAAIVKWMQLVNIVHSTSLQLTRLEISTRTWACQTWTPTTLKSSCCSAGSCSNRSGQDRFLVLLCPCIVRITQHNHETCPILLNFLSIKFLRDKITLPERWGDLIRRSVSMS